jgi:hypothetical protein
MPPNSCRLTHTEVAEIQGCKERPHGRRRARFRLALHFRLGARCACTGRARRADGRRWAFDFGATRARAGRAFSAIILAGRVINNHRLRFRDRTLQHILGEIGHGRALRLQHILADIGTYYRRGNGTLEHIFRQIGNGRARDLAADCALLGASSIIKAFAHQ